MVRAFKHATKRHLLGLTLRIRSGPLKGKRWIAVTGMKFIKGTYEPFTTALLQEHLREGDVFFDLGAHVGYTTAVASALVGPRGQVVAFEPRPINVRCLEKHLRVNRLTNVRLIQACVGDQTSRCRFETRTGTGTGHVTANGDLEVDMVSLDDLFAGEEIPEPDFLKIDVEGAEVNALEGAKTLLGEARPKVLVSIHGENTEGQVRELLGSLGYEFADLGERPGRIETDLLALPRD
jgi:FkbM family methyltransferase